MGESKDDIHVCIMCLRAIMNNKYGFNLVIKHGEAITCIALSLNHKSLRYESFLIAHFVRRQKEKLPNEFLDILEPRLWF